MNDPITSLSNFTVKENRKDRFLKQKRFRKRIIDVVYLLSGVLSATIGLKSFLLPNHFIDGGITGISLLSSALSGLPLSILIGLFNLPFIILGYYQLSRNFAIRTLCAILALSLCIFFLHFPILTDDKVLSAVFGGLLLGTGIGLSVRGGGVIDGTEVLALYISRKTALTIGDFIFIINIVIFSFAALLLSLEAAMYSTITYMVASKTVDYIISGIEEYTGVYIVSDKHETIRGMINNELKTGVTIYKGKRGFGKSGFKDIDTEILFTVVTRLEISKLKAELDKIDPSAFFITFSINDTKGGMLRKRRFH